MFAAIGAFVVGAASIYGALVAGNIIRPFKQPFIGVPDPKGVYDAASADLLNDFAGSWCMPFGGGQQRKTFRIVSGRLELKSDISDWQELIDTSGNFIPHKGFEGQFEPAPALRFNDQTIFVQNGQNTDSFTRAAQFLWWCGTAVVNDTLVPQSCNLRFTRC